MSDCLTLTDGLHCSVARGPQDACLVVQPIAGNDPFHILSYEQTWSCLWHHYLWLQHQVQLFQHHMDSDGEVVIAYLSSNTVDTLLSMLASTENLGYCSLGKITVVLLNIRWTAVEMAQVLCSEKSSSRTLLLFGDTLEEGRSREVANLLRHPVTCVPVPNLSKVAAPAHMSYGKKLNSLSLSHQCLSVETFANSGSKEDAFVLFTSGTTGGSRGVRLSHRALGVQSLAKLNSPCEYSRSTVTTASTVPLFHIGGLSSCLAVLFAGGTLIFPSQQAKSFRPVEIVKSLECQRFPTNTLVVVPTMLNALLNKIPVSVTYDHVQLILIGGQSALPPLVSRLQQAFPNAKLVQTYACTEAASSLTFWDILETSPQVQHGQKQVVQPVGSCVGCPPSHVNIRLRRLNATKDGAAEVINTPFQVGGIFTKGPHMMNGYWSRGNGRDGNNRDLGEWFETRDLGFLDSNGYLHFCGRSIDAIRSGAETILAHEVEQVLEKHPNILEAAVFGIPDDHWGEMVACAVVVDAKSNALGLNEIREWCQGGGLAGYKRPKKLFPVERLPRNSSGKLLKQALKLELTSRIHSKL